MAEKRKGEKEMKSFEIAILMFIGYLCVYSIVCKICDTAIKCATAKCVSMFAGKEKKEEEKNG